MAQIDMSQALTNPLSLTKFSVIRQNQVINNWGETKIDVEMIPVVRGVVFPEGPNGLSRRPEAQTNAKTLVIFTRFALRGASISANTDGSYQPDIIVWNGNRYLVAEIEDYSNYARGFIKVRAASTQEMDQAPVTSGPPQETELIVPGYGYDPYGGGSVDGFPPASEDCAPCLPACEVDPCL
jgi:hypothetical protein